MHVQLDPENAIKMQKVSNATNRSVGELVNAVLKAVDDVEYIEQIKVTTRRTPDEPVKQKRVFKHQRNWINRF